MPRLVPRPDEDSDLYHADIQRIITVCDRFGYEIDAATARWAWEQESEMMCAGWLYLPPDDESLFHIVKGRCQEIAND